MPPLPQGGIVVSEKHKHFKLKSESFAATRDRARLRLVSRCRLTVYGEMAEWLAKCEGILDAWKAVSERQEAKASQQRATGRGLD